MGKSAVREFLADDCMGLSQQAAYNSLLAFFPATIFLVSLLGLLGAYDTLEQFLDPVAPRAVTDLIRQLRQDTGRGGSVTAFVLGGIGAVWAASGATNALVKAVNRAYDRPETRPFWRVRLVAIGLVLALGVVVTGVLLLIVFGGPIGNAIARRAHLDGQFSVLWNLVRWPIAFAAVLLLFGLVYALAADRPRRAWKWITPGSVLGALLWLALSGLFALHVARRLLLADVRLARKRHRPPALAQLQRPVRALRRRAERRARAAGGRARAGRRGRRPHPAAAALVGALPKRAARPRIGPRLRPRCAPAASRHPRRSSSAPATGR